VLELGQPLGFGVDQRLFQCDVFSVELAEDLDRSAQGVEIHPADTQGQRIHLRPDLAPILLEPTVVLLQPMHMLDQVHVAPANNRLPPSKRTGPRTPAGRASSAATPPPTWCACAAPAQVEHTLAKRGAEKLWNLINTEPFVNSLGALTGNQAMQQVKAGLKAIYLSGWQVAGDANSNGEMYPDQSLYSVDSVPKVVKKINATFTRADQIQWSEGKNDIDYFAPIVADAEAGFGGVLNAFELMKAMIEAGAAGVHFEDQLAAAKKCGHMGGKVLVPTREAVPSWWPPAWLPT
jgi:hypothetical protein